MSEWVDHRLQSIAKAFDKSYCGVIEAVVDLICQRFQAGNKLLICGNGGSAADAQHLAAEFVGRFHFNRQALPAIALTANSSILTSVSNDYTYDIVFSRQVEALGQPGDILWGLSTSGKSANVLHALKCAKDKGLHTIGMAGNNGGLFQEFADYPLFIADKNTPCIQEVHLMTYHHVCEQVESRLFAQKSVGVKA